MEPKTTLQRKVVALSSKLPAITDKQKYWGFENCLDKYFVVSRSTSFCLECGHQWKNIPYLLNIIEQSCVCPNCNSNLKIKTSYNRNLRESAYYAIITTMEDMQVVRMFYAAKDMKKRHKQNLWMDEVMQHWIDKFGKVTTMTKNIHGLSMYYDQWVFHSELQVRHKSYKHCLRYKIGPYKIYPNRKILGIIKRNGFKGYFHGFSPQELFSLILSDNYAETLLKTGQIELLKKYDQNTLEIKCNWPSVKICIRNNYKIPDATMWLDYLRLLYQFGKDKRNPKYVCPDNLNIAHDRYVSKQREESRKLKIEELRKSILKDQENYEREKHMFFNLHFSDELVTVKTLESVEEFLTEGDELRHCVYTNKYYKKSESLILSARIKNKPIETVEVSLDKLKIIQSRGINNKPTVHHKHIIDLVNRHIPIIASRLIANDNSPASSS